ncbi:MAG: hypothetical protein ACPGNV_08805 [Mangrovicoccus sp.]
MRDLNPAIELIDTTALLLPKDGPLRRDYTRPAARRSDYYLQTYDAHTVVYDCVYLPVERGYLITAPRFLNLWRPFRQSLELDGQPVAKVWRRTWLRCEQVFIPAREGAELSTELAGIRYPLPARPSQAARFAGMNVQVAVSKNNHLSWIRDWAQYHQREHGLEGVVVFDNGSTDYSAEDLRATLTEVDGLKAGLVISAPFPYGPADKSGRFDVSPRFFQSAMLNLARRDALSQARAVLSIDIDEMVLPVLGDTVFDAAARHPLGMITLAGNWAYPSADTEGPAPQSAHIYRADPDRKCNRKWAMAPQGFMARVFGWAVHQVGGILQNLFTTQSRFRFIHCRACSTGWKRGRFKWPKPLVRSDQVARLMAKNFGPGS